MIVEQFAAALEPAEQALLSSVGDYAAWRGSHHEGQFRLTDNDDVAIRTFLTHLRAGGADRESYQAAVAALKRLYEWATSEQLIQVNPFEEYELDRPYLAREQIRRRDEVLGRDAETRELARLRGLVQITEQLNRSAEVQTLLDGVIQTLSRVLELQTAWAFISTESGIHAYAATAAPLHDFLLASARGLPPGLEQDERRQLTCPPDCHCQSFFRAGHLNRAVNIVECTRLANAAYANGDVSGLSFHASVPLVAGGRRFGLINVATAEWQLLTSADLEFLSAVGSQVAAALERAHLYEMAQAQRDYLEHELQVAHQVQASLLPRELPELAGLQLAADWRSAREVAGDFYDIFPLHEGRWGIVVGDVADKGAPAALYMSMTRALIRSAAPHFHNPAHALMQVNERLTEESSYDIFVTLFYGVLDPAARTLHYANAGHNPPLLRRATGEIELLTRTGRIVGAFPSLRVTDASVALAAGDVLVIYTDGVTDALDAAGQDFGMERLTAAVQAGPREAATMLNHLRGELSGFTQAAAQPDDITLFVVAAL